MLISYLDKDAQEICCTYELGIQEKVLAGDKYLENISIEFVFKVIRLNDNTKDVCVIYRRKIPEE